METNERYCIETRGLTYRFSEKETVLRHMDLQVPQGSIYGFLGPNGAGKTTTLRLLLGLLRKQQGQISIFGKAFEQHRCEVLSRLGSLIESPSLYAHLSAIDNLRVWQKIYRCPAARLTEVLTLVGLQDTGNKKAGRFSLGMKQRLSIAVALLNDPELLILDEPTNGLDPNGIIDMRELLKKLNREKGITIVVSSHLLAEIEKLVTHVGIIHKGELLFQGTLSDLVSRQQQSSVLVIDTADAAKALALARVLHPEAHIEQGRLVLAPMANERIATLNRHLVGQGLDVYGIGTVRNDLETIFMDLVK